MTKEDASRIQSAEASRPFSSYKRDADIEQAKSGNDPGFAERAQSAADRNANANASSNTGSTNTNTSSNTGGQKK
jgi:hypothetical protein